MKGVIFSMNDRSLHVLEFVEIIDKLEQQAETSIGTELIQQLTPATTLEEVQQLQFETDEAVQIIRLNKVIPLGGIMDIRQIIQHSKMGRVLAINDCLQVSSTIYGGQRAKRALEQLDEDLPILKEFSEQIIPLKDLENTINKCIDDDGNILDSASSKLRSIRSSIRTYEQRVRERLDNFTRTQSNLLSEAIVTIRNDRYVLPVKHEHRSSIGGIVHDQSASGQTLFMEPEAVVTVNNELQSAKVKEKQEIEQILQKLSEHIADHQADLTGNIAVLAEIDFIYARAKLGQNMNAVMPKINNEGIINMQQGRHPLIPTQEVVANDIEIGQDYTSILITGPNTGGKTVTLKMVGLCTLMAQSGLQIPALDGCEMAVFSQVFADIGDEQSIEQNLSTFSSHMTNIVNIISQVDHQSLVLFDELGAGTDPQEGASLAMSILDEVVSRDARVIATTHYPELKAYAYNRENVINASVEFDVHTLQPTYRLLIGIPGRSNAFDISKRLGLDEKIITKAQQHMGADSESVENMIHSLEKSYKKANKSYAEAEQVLNNSTQLLHELKQQWDHFEHQREQLYEKAEHKAEKALNQAKKEAENIVADIRKMKSATAFKEHEWIDARRKLSDAELQLTTKEKADQENKHEKQTPLQTGDEIKLLTINQQGTVLEKVSNDEYIVQVGVMRVNVNRKDIEYIPDQQIESTPSYTSIRGTGDHVKLELDLRGERYEDALNSLEQYIDNALLAGHGTVSIIHGKGTGALRKGVQKFCNGHPRIKSYRDGKSGEGGSGVTVIELT